MRRPLTLLALAALSTAGLLAVPAAAHADPHQCFVITDGNGNPINTTCVPWFLPPTP